jgi:hypothetical protein
MSGLMIAKSRLIANRGEIAMATHARPHLTVGTFRYNHGVNVEVTPRCVGMPGEGFTGLPLGCFRL